MSYPVTLIPGDGIGREITKAAKDIIDATGVPIDWHTRDAGAEIMDRHDSPLPVETLDSIISNRVALKGPLTTPIGHGFSSVNVSLRKKLDLYVNYRPVKSIKGVPGKYSNIDLIIVRENTEGLYSGLEHVVAPGVVESLRIITEKGSRRIIDFAFKTAREYKRKKVTVVHKANILKLSDGLFLDVAQQIARSYPEIEYEEMIVDATAMKLVMDPHHFDVMVMENLFGDIISDLASGLIGGLGMAPGANIGSDYAIFEAVHGSAPDIAGKGIANPSALILAGALMLKHLGENKAAEKIKNSLRSVIKQKKNLTADLGGKASTAEYAGTIIENL
ncbi:MAG: NAD-dependent isocitrate dehydrogenase [bacterium]|nr:NAD-dependent isocitrate dehydrogenase [bacterium]